MAEPSSFITIEIKAVFDSWCLKPYWLAIRLDNTTLNYMLFVDYVKKSKRRFDDADFSDISNNPVVASLDPAGRDKAGFSNLTRAYKMIKCFVVSRAFERREHEPHGNYSNINK